MSLNYICIETCLGIESVVELDFGAELTRILSTMLVVKPCPGCPMPADKGICLTLTQITVRFLWWRKRMPVKES